MKCVRSSYTFSLPMHIQWHWDVAVSLSGDNYPASRWEDVDLTVKFSPQARSGGVWISRRRSWPNVGRSVPRSQCQRYEPRSTYHRQYHQYDNVININMRRVRWLVETISVCLL